MSLGLLSKLAHQQKALQALESYGMLDANGHFDYGNGFHGPVYIMPDRIRARPAVAMDLVSQIIPLLPSELIREIGVVLGPVRGGVQLASYMAIHLDAMHFAHHNPNTEVIRYVDRKYEDGVRVVSSADRKYIDAAGLVQELGEDNRIPNGKDAGKRVIFLEHVFCAEAAKDRNGDLFLPKYFRDEIIPGRKVCLLDDVKNTSRTFFRSAALVHEAGGEVVATAVLYDRLHQQPEYEVLNPRGRSVPHIALAEFEDDPTIWPKATCPLCAVGKPITKF